MPVIKRNTDIFVKVEKCPPSSQKKTSGVGQVHSTVTTPEVICHTASAALIIPKKMRKRGGESRNIRWSLKHEGRLKEGTAKLTKEETGLGWVTKNKAGKMCANK